MAEQYNWMWENNINSGKEPIDIDQPQEFKYSQWRTNSSLSNHHDTIGQANRMNMMPHLSDKMHYHFLYHAIRKHKRYGKKKTEEDKKQEKASLSQAELINLISNHYKYSNVRAKEALSVLSDKQIEFIVRKEKEKGG